MRIAKGITIVVALSCFAWPVCRAAAEDSIFRAFDHSSIGAEAVADFLESRQVKRYRVVTVRAKILREAISKFEQPGLDKTCCPVEFQLFPDLTIIMYTYAVRAEWLERWIWSGVDTVESAPSVTATLTVGFADTIAGSFYGPLGRIKIEPLNEHGIHVIWEPVPSNDNHRID